MSKKLKKGSSHPIYLHPENQTYYLGEATLLEYISEGLTFYDLEEKKDDDKMYTIYSTEKWKVSFTESNHYPVGFEKIVSIRKIVYSGGNKDMISKYTTYQLNETNKKIEQFNKMADKTTSEVGTIVSLNMAFLNNEEGALGVCFNNYGSRSQYIFENGHYDGFSLQEQEIFLTYVGFDEQLSNYKFKNVMQVSHDFREGVFKSALQNKKVFSEGS